MALMFFVVQRAVSPVTNIEEFVAFAAIIFCYQLRAQATVGLALTHTLEVFFAQKWHFVLRNLFTQYNSWVGLSTDADDAEFFDDETFDFHC
jgi:hypothetical protein